jgi:hypothetical protein
MPIKKKSVRAPGMQGFYTNGFYEKKEPLPPGIRDFTNLLCA